MKIFSIIIFCLVSFCENTVSSENDLKVINGKDAEQGQFPWQVIVFSEFNDGFNYTFCGGAVISNTWILTSASCIYQAELIKIYTGSIEIANAPGKMSYTTKFIIHEDFNNQTFHNNIGLVNLDTALVLDGNTDVIRLADDVLESKTNVTIAGWGHSNHDINPSTIDNITNILQYVNVPTISNLECAKTYGTTIVDANVICTRNPDKVKGPCVHDAGNPLVINADTDPVHVGIFSVLGENGCNNNYPAVYVRTYSYTNWIKEKTNI